MMSTSDEWERWLHLGGLGGGPGDGAQPGAEAGTGSPDADDPDDPWGSLDLDLTPLTDAQRDHLRLGAPSLLEELDAVDGAGVDTSAGVAAAEVSAELATAFQAIDEVDEVDPADEP